MYDFDKELKKLLLNEVEKNVTRYIYLFIPFKNQFWQLLYMDL